MPSLDRSLSVAPMMACTDRHDRFFLRTISRHTLLYSEMITTGALLHGDRERLLRHDSRENPLALQVGGSSPREMAECARIAEGHGYDEVNMNAGCPSKRVRSGRFGACLMAEPELVANCIAPMIQAVNIPVTVKTRIGIDDQDSYENLAAFIRVVSAAGCRTFIIHARKAWLTGISPKQNRNIPPLRYDVVTRIKEAFPQLDIVLNGGITSLVQAQEHLKTFDGVMIGREAYRNPYMLASADRLIFADDRPVPKRHEIIQAFLPYVDQQLDEGIFLSRLTRHILGLYQGVPGAKAWRRHLSEHACKPGAGTEVITQALDIVGEVETPTREYTKTSSEFVNQMGKAQRRSRAFYIPHLPKERKAAN